MTDEPLEYSIELDLPYGELTASIFRTFIENEAGGKYSDL